MILIFVLNADVVEKISNVSHLLLQFVQVMLLVSIRDLRNILLSIGIVNNGSCPLDSDLSSLIKSILVLPLHSRNLNLLLCDLLPQELHTGSLILVIPT